MNCSIGNVIAYNDIAQGLILVETTWHSFGPKYYIETMPTVIILERADEQIFDFGY